MVYILVLGAMIVIAVLGVLLPIPGFNIAIPLFSTVMSTQEAFTLAVAYFFVNYIAIAWVFRKFVQKELVLLLVPTSLLGGIAGGLLTSSLSEFALTLVLFAFVAYFFARRLKITIRPHEAVIKKKGGRHGASFVGLVAGFLQGGGLGGGEVRNSYMYARGLNLQQARGTTACVGAMILLTSLVTRVLNDTSDFTNPLLYAALVPIAFGAAYVGLYVTSRLNERAQSFIILGLMAFSVCLLIYKITTLV